MIGLLLRFRYVTAAVTTALLIVLVFFGKKVSYEQSIGSFFADDDPYMAVYQKAANSFGDDNFVFLVYDDPDLVTPRGLDRVAELAAAVGPDRIAGVMPGRIARRHAAGLVAGRCPDRAGPPARTGPERGPERGQADDQERRSEDQCADGQRSGTGRRSARAAACSRTA